MKPWSCLLLVAAIVLPLPAQAGCTFERARTVPASWICGPVVQCESNLVFQLGGVTVTSPRNGCPLFAIITPQHEVAEPSAHPTMVRNTAQAAVHTVFFQCDGDYFLIFRLSGTCVFDRMVVSGAVDRLETIPCPQAVADPTEP